MAMPQVKERESLREQGFIGMEDFTFEVGDKIGSRPDCQDFRRTAKRLMEDEPEIRNDFRDTVQGRYYGKRLRKRIIEEYVASLRGRTSTSKRVILLQKYERYLATL